MADSIVRAGKKDNEPTISCSTRNYGDSQNMKIFQKDTDKTWRSFYWQNLEYFEMKIKNNRKKFNLFNKIGTFESTLVKFNE